MTRTFSSLLQTALRAGLTATLVTLTTVATAAGPLSWLAGQRGGEGNLDGPVASASWAGGPLMLHTDGDGTLVIDHYGGTLRRIDRRGNVTTLAGRAGQRGLADGRSANARFSWPNDAARGPDGRIYIADTSNDAIRIVTASSEVSTLKMQPGSAPQHTGDKPIDGPQALAFDAAGRLWVVMRSSVAIVTPDGKLQRWEPKEMPEGIVDVAADARGQIWGITSSRLMRLHLDRAELVVSLKPPEWLPPIGYRVAPPQPAGVAARYGQVPFIGRAPLPPEPSPPPEAMPPNFESLAIDAVDGNIYIADTERLLKLAAGGSSLQTLFKVSKADFPGRDDGFGSISAHAGEVLVATKQSGLYRLDKSGTPRPYSGAWHDFTAAADATPLHRMRADDTVLLQKDGSVLFLARLDHVIGRLDANGKSELWAGGEKGRRNGTRLAARFHFPADMVQDRAGNIYVADGGNGAIRRIDADGNVTVIAGNSPTQDRVDGIGRDARFWRPKRLALDEERGILYVLDTSPYIGRSSTQLRSVTLATAAVRTLAAPEVSAELLEKPTLQSFVLRSGMANLEYEDIAVGGNGMVYALEGHVVWRIDPASGKHTLVFAEGDNPGRDAHYLALKQARDRGEDTDRLDNHLIRCDWAWCGPDRIEADAQGRVYLSDSGSHTVIRIDLDGQAGVIAGQPGRRGNLDGSLPGALNRPDNLAWTRDGALMIVTEGKGVMLLRAPHKAPLREKVPALARPE